MGFAIPQLALMTGAMVSFAICFAIVLTKEWHGQHTLDSSSGVQKIHEQPTPRVGGVAIFFSLIVSWWLTPPIVANVLGPMIIASIPAFFMGVLEDIVKRGRVAERLFATFMSGLIAWFLLDVSLKGIDVLGIDAILKFLPLSVVFTAFAVGGVANSINIIDGLNGLAAGIVLLCLTALGLIAYQVYDYEIAKLCFVIGGAIFGFLVINYPLGKIFLGDGGAYLLGFLLGWTAVMTTARNPEISPWAPMLACGYPVLEVLFSMARRKARKLKLGHPDRLHLHSLIWARFVRPRLRSKSVILQNAAVFPIVLIYASIPATLAVIFKTNTLALIISFGCCAFIYAVLYARLVHFGWAWPRLCLLTWSRRMGNSK